MSRLVEGLESGGAFVTSRLRTTAGAPASIGRAQLLVPLQVRAMQELPEATLARLGITRVALESIATRGAAALAYYDYVVRGRGRGPAGLDPAALESLRSAVAERDFEKLRREHGPSFEAATGLPARELEMLARTRDLVRAVRSVARGESVAVARRRFDLEALRGRLGEHLDFYLRRGHVAENRAAWFTRAAMTRGPAFEGFVEALSRGGDRLASEQRALRNHRAASSLLAGLGGAETLGQRGRLLLLAQLVRIRHASPAAFRALFYAGDAPRHRDVDSLRRALDELAALPDGPGGRAQLGRTIRVARRAAERA